MNDFSDSRMQHVEATCMVLDCSRGEAQAFNTYWRQRLGVAIVRGVAKTILGNMPRCTGAHYAVGRGLDVDLAPAPGPRPGNRTQNQHCDNVLTLRLPATQDELA